jgi:hypothetical protein
MFDVSPRQLLEGAGTSFGLPLGLGVLALGDLEHDSAGQLAGVGQIYRVSFADQIPSRSPLEIVDAHPGLRPRRFHPNGEAALVVVPNQEAALLRF